MFRYFLCWIFFAYPLMGEIESQHMEMHCREGAGMFSIFHDVLAMCKAYDQGKIAGMSVNFESEGLYYAPEYGQNWWSYYCEPIDYGPKDNVRKIIGDCPGTEPLETERHTTRHEAKALIDKYIHFKPGLLDKIARLQKQYFNDAVICVHYRGTDKWTEAYFISHEDAYAEIQKVIGIVGKKNYRIFVATDEPKFLDYMQSKFQKRLICNPEAIRTDEPLHFSSHPKYKIGEDAIIDAVLLSKGCYLVRTSSNLSRWSTFFNPDIPVLELNQLSF